MNTHEAVKVQVRLDRASAVPLYHQLTIAIRKAIEDGELAPGGRLENEIAMAQRLRISRPTARRALAELVDMGMLVRKRGVGTQVAPVRVRRKVDLTSLYDDLDQAGRHPETTVLEYKVAPGAKDVTALLDLPEGSDVVMIKRIRLAEGEPLALMTNYLALDIAPSYEELGASGLYHALRGRGVQIHMAHQQIGARTATTAEARILNEKPRVALLTMERTAYDVSGRAIEFGRHIYLASRYSFSTTLFAR